VEVDTWTFPVRAGDVVLMCSDGLTSMIGEDQIAAVLSSEPDLDRAGERLIAEANAAGGRDNITVVLFRLEETDSRSPGDGAGDQPTEVGLAVPRAVGSDARSQPAADRSSPSAGATLTALERPAPGRVVATDARPRPPLARTQGRRAESSSRRGQSRWFKPIAALTSVVIVLFLFGGGGYLASRELFFIGTNSDGIVTVYRGLPYDGPFGLRLYEQVYVSGVPAGAVPADRRPQLLNHNLRSQADAISLVRAAERGQLSR
jgi:protein phosphatase